MNSLDLLVDSLEFIENNLKEDINTASICRFCGCSKSSLEKVFRCVINISVHDYIVRRRMMLAAKDISGTDKSLLEIAFEYGYTSNESFTRAFKKIWNVNPSEVRGRKIFELFPKLRMQNEEGDEYIMSRKNVDISELYDVFVERKNCYFVCCDIKSLIPINEIARKAGDLAILEAMNRLNRYAGEDDLVFRIGGDEFCILTASADEAYAEKIKENILNENGNRFFYQDMEIPLTLYAACVKYSSKQIKYNALFTELHNSIKEVKQ